MNIANYISTYSQSFSKLYPTEIVKACGGIQRFDELKTVDCDHLTGFHGSVNSEVVTEPIMIGVNRDQRAFIILTFDVYDSQGTKIAKKVSEVFHNDSCVYEWDHGIETWQGSYQIYGNHKAGSGMSVVKIAERIQILLSGKSVMEPHRFNYGDASYIKLWSKDSK